MFRVSERFACRVVGQHRSTQRHAGKVVDIEEAKLRRRLREIAAEHIRCPRFQERCHPSRQYIRGHEDMSNASLQRGRQG